MVIFGVPSFKLSIFHDHMRVGQPFPAKNNHFLVLSKLSHYGHFIILQFFEGVKIWSKMV